ncbi:MAG TPA: hypothetical protein VFE50_10205 [Cyclobacteriaceae bacterium]|nr:hypothetical protein [Cyclobacteriaceae bacterium]
MEKLLLTIVTILVSGMISYGQGTAILFVDFAHNIEGKNTDKLSGILVDGFLKGKIRAYRSPELTKHFRIAEAIAHDLPRRWSRKPPEGINTNDPVDVASLEEPSFNSRPQVKPARSEPPATIIISNADTLSKEEFLRQMILEDTQPGDKVQLPFYGRISELNGISIIGKYKVHGKDSTWTPDIIRLRRAGEWKGILEDIDVNFLYSDVLQYLSSIRLPILQNGITYRELLKGNMFFGNVFNFNAVIQTPAQGGLNVRALPPAKEYFYLEKYLVNAPDIQDDSLRTEIKIFAQLLSKAFKEKQIKFTEERTSLYPAKYDWSTIKNVTAMATGIKKEYWINLLHDYIADERYPAQINYYESTSVYLQDTIEHLDPDLVQLGITNMKRISASGSRSSTSQEVVQVSLRNLSDFESRPEYTFDWRDVRKILMNSRQPAMLKFVARVEKGNIKFSESKLVHSVCELN